MGKKGEARRQQILDEAKKMLLEEGLDAFVLRDIAERIGITHGNLQYYFRTRQDLLMAIFDEDVARYTEGIKEAVAATSTKRGRLGAIIESGFSLVRAPEASMWRMAFSLADHNREMASILKKENDRYEEVLVRELKQIAPELSAQRRRHIAKIVQTMLDGLSIQFTYHKPDSPEMLALQSEMKIAIAAIVDAK